MTPETSDSQRRGTLAIVVAACCWGLLGVMARVALADGVPPLTIAFWRASMAAVLFTVHAAMIRAEPLRRADRPAALFLGVAGVAVFYLAYLNKKNPGRIARKGR